MTFKAGDKVMCVNEDLAWYTLGEIYEVGVDEFQDFGVLNEDNEVYYEGLLEDVSGIYKEDWEEAATLSNFELVME